MNGGRNLLAFVAGLMFAIGLGVGGMTDPNKVLAFLDITGSWDPSLALVMGGAIAVFAPAFHWLARREASLLGGPVHLPKKTVVDGRLLLGAAMFGVGWGLAGYCPGPALVGSMSMASDVLTVTGSMLVGMVGFSVVFSVLDRKANRS